MSASYPTPVYSHVGRGDFTDVYEPAEDTFLLMDALEKDAETLQRVRWLKALTQLQYLSAIVKKQVFRLKEYMKTQVCRNTELIEMQPQCVLYTSF